MLDIIANSLMSLYPVESGNKKPFQPGNRRAGGSPEGKKTRMKEDK